MRLAAWGGIIRSGEQGLQGKFCLSRKFVPIIRCDALQPFKHLSFRQCLGCAGDAAPSTGRAIHIGNEKTKRSWPTPSDRRLSVSVLPLPLCDTGTVATWMRHDVRMGKNTRIPHPAGIFHSLLFLGRWLRFRRSKKSNNQGNRSLELDLRTANSHERPHIKLRVSWSA